MLTLAGWPSPMRIAGDMLALAGQIDQMEMGNLVDDTLRRCPLGGQHRAEPDERRRPTCRGSGPLVGWETLVMAEGDSGAGRDGRGWQWDVVLSAPVMTTESPTLMSRRTRPGPAHPAL